MMVNGMSNRPLTEEQKNWYTRELAEAEVRLKDTEQYIALCKDRLENGMWKSD